MSFEIVPFHWLLWYDIIRWHCCSVLLIALRDNFHSQIAVKGCIMQFMSHVGVFCLWTLISIRFIFLFNFVFSDFWNENCYIYDFFIGITRNWFNILWSPGMSWRPPLWWMSILTKNTNYQRKTWNYQNKKGRQQRIKST